jgi:pyruvate/2-oxoglutarate dehydrogenase complex dihydrolipoamide dehydrogenase (E3) component
MASEERYDLVVIGGGQGGIPLAHALAGEGRRVALAERKQLGGSCVNFGCTPTKAAIASARLAQDARRASEFGVRIPSVDVDFAAVIARARAIAAESRIGLEKKLRDRDNPKWLEGHARLAGRDGSGFVVRLGDLEVRTREVVLDTGTRTVVPKIPGIETVPFLHAGNWLDTNERPDHVLMLGGGVIALEMSQFYRRMGSRVTVIERNPRVAKTEDEDVSQAICEALASEGVAFVLDTVTDSISSGSGEVRLTVQSGGRTESLTGSHLFVATGRKPNTDDLGLESVGVAMSPAGIVQADERLATNVPGIWVAGDIRGGPQFTHTSWDDYRILLSQMTGRGGRTTKRIVPYAIFTDPELGRVGMTEAEARASGRAHTVHRFDMSHSGRARERGSVAGFIKVIVESGSGAILGAAALADQGAELIHLYVDLMNAGAKASVIRDAVHIHPTLAEAFQSAIADVRD